MFRHGLQSFTIINCCVVNKDKFHRCKQSLEGTIFHCGFIQRVRRFLQTQQGLIKRYHYTHLASNVLFILFSNSIERAFIGILIAFTVTFDIVNTRNSKEENILYLMIFPLNVRYESFIIITIVNELFHVNFVLSSKYDPIQLKLSIYNAKLSLKKCKNS